MNSFVYVVLYDDTSVLVARKFERWNDEPDNVILHFAGQDVFPGGKVEDGEALLNAAIREFEEETGMDLSDTDIVDDFGMTVPDAVDFFPAPGGCSYYALYVKCENLEDLAEEINDLLSSEDRRDIVDGELESVRTELREDAMHCFNTVIPVSDPACLRASHEDRDWFRAILSYFNS